MAGVEPALRRGLTLYRWWRRTDADDSYAQRFKTVCTFNRPDRSFAFFDSAPDLGGEGATRPVMGDVMDLFYDRPKDPGLGATEFRRQLREFVLRYFMRVSDTRRPEAVIEGRGKDLPAPLRPFSWCPSEEHAEVGFGYSQLYYKRRTDGRIGKFAIDERSAIVDARELFDRYEWVVLRVRIFDFNLDFRPFGPGTPEIQLPLRQHQLVVLAPELIVDWEAGHGEPAEHGFGYVVLPPPDQRGPLAYGPGHFALGFQLFHFCVGAGAEARARLVFVVNRPTRVLDVSLNPLDWGLQLGRLFTGENQGWLESVERATSRLAPELPGIDPVFGSVSLLNLLTGGVAGRELCISREQLEKEMLVKHFQQNYELISGSLQTWRQIPDWLASEELPSWVRTGWSS